MLKTDEKKPSTSTTFITIHSIYMYTIAIKKKPSLFSNQALKRKDTVFLVESGGAH